MDDEKLEEKELQEQEEEIVKQNAKAMLNEATRRANREVLEQGKKLAKRALKRIIARLAPLLIKIALIALIVFLLLAFLGGFVSIIDTQTLLSASQVSMEIAEDVSIETEEGGWGYRGYINLSDNAINKLVTSLIEQGVTPERLKLTGERDEEIENKLEQNAIVNGETEHQGDGKTGYQYTIMKDEEGNDIYILPATMKRFFRAYYAAELTTQYPDMSNDPSGKLIWTNFLKDIVEGAGKYQGCIKIIDEDTKSYLSYRQPDEFKKLCENNSDEALKHFSLEGTSLLIAGYEEDLKTGTKTMYSTPVNYKAIASKYGMPMEFLISLNLVTGNPTFTLAVASLALNSEIILTRQFNTVEVEKNEHREWDEEELVEHKVPVLDANNMPVYVNGIQQFITTEVLEIVHKTSDQETHTKSCNPTVQLSLADAWYVKEEVTYQKQDNPVSLDESYVEGEVSVEITGTQTTSTYTADPTSKPESKENKFIGLLKNAEGGEYNEDDDFSQIPEYISEGNHKIVKYHLPLTKNYDSPNHTIVSGAENLFELLASNSKTQNQEQIMRYLLYKYTGGKNYGVTDFEEMMASLITMTEVGTGDFVVDTRACDQSLLISDVETLKKAFSGYGGSSQLIAHAEEFLNMQNTYHVNAVFAAAVSITETSAGRAGHAVNGKNNWFNIQCTCGDSSHGRFEKYASVQDAVNAFGRLISGGLYFGDGKNTVSSIGARYCPNEEVEGQANKWANNTNAYMVQMYNEAGIDISSVISSSTAVGKVAKMIEWAESYVGRSQYTRPSNGVTHPSDGWCAGFASSAYEAGGFTYLGGDAKSMGHLGTRHTIITIGGKIDCTGIAPGALFIDTDGFSGYGHVALYVGNGYVIEAGGTLVQKVPIDQSYCANGRYDYWAYGAELEQYMLSAEYKALIENTEEE